MNDRDIRLECLRLALGSMPIPGVRSDYKSETVLEIAHHYYDFLTSAGPVGMKRAA